jgi:heat shock protein HslJ
MRPVPTLCLALLAACTASTNAPAASEATPTGATDDGTYLAQIDPLGGQWQVGPIGTVDLTRYKAWVNFSAGGFINHGAGCAGGHPAFYRLDGTQVTVTRLEPIRIGKCAGTQEMLDASPAERARAADSERVLATFIDQLASWQRIDDRTLELVDRTGRRVRLTRPAEPHPALAGRWLIEQIGGEPLETERRPPILTFSQNGIGASADCNAIGGTFSIPAPGRITVEGPLVSTAMGCPPEDMAEDALMSRAMTAATSYRIDGDRLTLTGGPGMTLRRPPAPNRRLAGEYEACGNTLLGAYNEGPITLAFDGDTVRDNAGCVARYSADGARLALTRDDGPACADSAPPFKPGEPIGIGGEISVLAVARPDGFAFNDQGQLILRTTRGLLTMCRKGDPPPFGS